MQLDIRAVIFDMDGLLLDSEVLYKIVWKNAARALGHEMSDDLFLKMVGRTAPDSRKILEEAYPEGFSYDTFRQAADALAIQHLNEQPIPLKPGVREFLDWCQQRSLPMAVASSTATDVARRRLEHAGLLPYFQAVIGGDQVAYGKPAPEIFVHAAGALVVSPFYCLALEDSHAGVRSAFAADMITFMIPDLMPVTDEMEELADGIFPTLHEALVYLKAHCK